MTPVRLEPSALRSRVKHSTTEPLRSQFVCVFDREFVCEGQEVSVLERDHNAVTLDRIKPAVPRSRVKHSTTVCVCVCLRGCV